MTFSINVHRRDRRRVSGAVPVVFPSLSVTLPVLSGCLIDNGLDPEFDTSFVVADATVFTVGDVIRVCTTPASGGAAAAPIFVSDELMTITVIDLMSGQITVTRGAFGTTPESLIDTSGLWNYGPAADTFLDVVLSGVPLVAIGMPGVVLTTPGGELVADSAEALGGSSLRLNFPSAVFQYSALTVGTLGGSVRSAQGAPMTAGTVIRTGLVV